jgi:hypothetical protein
MNIAHIPLNDPLIESSSYEFIQAINPDAVSLANWQTETYIESFVHWINSSSHNKIQGLDAFPYRAYTAGTSAGIQSFIHRHCVNRRIRFSEAEFVASKIVSNHAGANYLHLEKDDIAKNDAVVISFPFCGNGGIYHSYDTMIQQCNLLEVPVLIDLAYFGISQGLSFDLTHPCITDVVFSLSKPFVTQLRLGLRLTKNHVDDLVQSESDIKIYNRMAGKVAVELMKQFSHDYIVSKYLNKQKNICQKLQISPTPTLTLALGNSTHKEFYRNGYYRICITNELQQEL